MDDDTLTDFDDLPTIPWVALPDVLPDSAAAHREWYGVVATPAEGPAARRARQPSAADGDAFSTAVIERDIAG